MSWATAYRKICPIVCKHRFGKVECAPRLDLLGNQHEIAGGKLGDGPGSDLGEDVRLQPAKDILSVPRALHRRPMGMPGGGNRLEAVLGSGQASYLGLLSNLHRVDALREQVAGFLTEPAGISKGDLIVDP